MMNGFEVLDKAPDWCKLIFKRIPNPQVNKKLHKLLINQDGTC